VRGEALFTRVDGSTGRLADAVFATNFANDVQRSLVNGSTAMSSALFAAGLVAALPLAAAEMESDPQPGALALGATVAIDGAVQAVQSVEPDRPDEFWLGDYAIAPDEGERGATMPTHHLADESRFDDTRHADFGRIESANARAVTPALETVEPLRATVQGGPFEGSSDQSLMALAMPQGGMPAQANPIDALVVNALEGPTVDLDALLGPQPPSSEVDVLLKAMPDGGDPFGTSSFFMPDLAQQQIAAQLEHVAATGHA
jgi:hypothetical protein